MQWSYTPGPVTTLYPPRPGPKNSCRPPSPRPAPVILNLVLLRSETAVAATSGTNSQVTRLIFFGSAPALACGTVSEPTVTQASTDPGIGASTDSLILLPAFRPSGLE